MGAKLEKKRERVLDRMNKMQKTLKTERKSVEGGRCAG
jgi:hypothetical protein